jgi:nucleoside-diphosphate-sugar epimerase
VPDDAVPADLRLTRSVAQHFLADCRKAVDVLGWRPADPQGSIARSVAWHLANPPDETDPDFGPDDSALSAP